MHEDADAHEQTVRISRDANAAVTGGPCARDGTSRVLTNAADHDVQPEAMVTPVGMFVPTSDALFLSAVTSKVTSDGLMDRVIEWWESVTERFSPITTLVITLDHGPENHRRRTPCMQRVVECVQPSHITVQLASSPPSHRTSNPVERWWGILEQHWNGSVLDSGDAVIPSARTMTWKGKHPVVSVVTNISQTGITRTKEAMEVVETHLQRVPALEQWFVDITSLAPPLRESS